MLKENDRAHLKELTQLYTGRTMFGESIPEDLTKMLAELRTLSAIDQSSLIEEALKEFTSKETALRDKYETRYGRWILNRIRQHITNPNAIRAWAQELASLPFDLQTNQVDVAKAYQVSQILSELLKRFEKGEIAGRKDLMGTISGTI